MMTSITEFFGHLYTVLVLKDFGWERRKWMCHRESVIQWRDPFTGLWYSEKTAKRLVRVQILDQLKSD